MDSLDENQFLLQKTLAAEIEDTLHENEEISIRVFHHPTTYLVQEGDTLLKLGWRMRMPYWMIMEANPETYSLGLQTGQTLTIPSLDDQLPLPVVRDKRIVMSISEQRLRTYEDGQLMDEYIISTGIDRSPTQPGVFQVQTHELNAYASVWDLYMPHFLGIYEAWPDFMNGLHGLPTLSNGRRLWADILGRPASFGCIILDLDAAEALYEWADDGVVVEILE
jgi:lipoprotein-anchoring transpeptidase ErfK/SrfK